MGMEFLLGQVGGLFGKNRGTPEKHRGGQKDDHGGGKEGQHAAGGLADVAPSPMA